ncbi:MAG: hypothetical protein QOF49_332 [Chloroflexota bacterium]|nr:hypothetical protein [Chloroflexota bacterium]
MTAAPSFDELSRFDASPDGPSPPGAVAAFDFDALEADRSFLAQPEPLKWIDGAEKAFRIGPPLHTGHALGPSALIPWITSNRLPQLAQTYS